MRLTTITPENQQRLAVLVPLIALFLSLFVVYPAWGRYTDLRARNEEKSRELAQLQALPIPEPGPVRPAEENLPSELPQFLGHISTLAAAANCRIVGFEALAPEKKEGATGPVQALQARVDLEEPYPLVRAFLAHLAKSDRLYVVAGIDITPVSSNSPTAGPLRTSITIERYVTPTGGGPAPPTQ